MSCLVKNDFRSVGPSVPTTTSTRVSPACGSPSYSSREGPTGPPWATGIPGSDQPRQSATMPLHPADQARHRNRPHCPVSLDLGAAHRRRQPRDARGDDLGGGAGFGAVLAVAERAMGAVARRTGRQDGPPGQARPRLRRDLLQPRRRVAGAPDSSSATVRREGLCPSMRTVSVDADCRYSICARISANRFDCPGRYGWSLPLALTKVPVMRSHTQQATANTLGWKEMGMNAARGFGRASR